jgi:hypothetical protein
VKLRMGGLGDSLERLVPFLTIVAIVTGGWFWLIQPRLGAYLRVRTEVAALEERVRTLQQASARVRPQLPADLEGTQHEFEARVSADDKVADVAAAIARAVLASAPADMLRAFVIETGDRTSSPELAGSGDMSRVSATAGMDGADPRLALFPYAVSYTPLRVTFESTFEAAGNVLWRMRDLPTVVEVRSATLTRGLPLMKTELLVRVLQRGDTVDPGSPAVPAVTAPPVPGPTAPRLAPYAAEAGTPR